VPNCDRIPTESTAYPDSIRSLDDPCIARVKVTERRNSSLSGSLLGVDAQAALRVPRSADYRPLGWRLRGGASSVSVSGIAALTRVSRRTRTRGDCEKASWKWPIDHKN
jgi:hypothetical protein